MNLKELLHDTGVLEITGKADHSSAGFGGNDIEITSIHYRSQDVKPGGLFIAVPGHVADGHDYIDQALERGASAVVVERQNQKGSVIIRVENTRIAMGKISSNFFGRPSEELTIVGITGTNGKTTTAYLVENILITSGFKTGVIGTISTRYDGKEYNNPVTTPESMDLQKILADMRDRGITHVVMEVSSHALDLNRVENCWIDIGVFTNLTQDHLDYHKDMDTYWACKKRLFTDILMKGPKKNRTIAVINCNDPKGEELYKTLSIDRITTGHSSDNMLWPKISSSSLDGITGTIITPEGEFNFKSSLAGKHNQENILSAAGVGIALGLPITGIKTGLEKTDRVPGRLERVESTSDVFLYVDYAHTPDALKNVLSSLKSITDRKIICVFGCGGDRDKKKRPQMGEIAARLCDLSIITSDNPRSEPPMLIIEEILRGTKKTGIKRYRAEDLENGMKDKGYLVEPDRKKAIQTGITAACSGDTVLIAGKGHETYQIIGDTTIDFDDRKEAKKVMKLLCGLSAEGNDTVK